MTKTHNISIDHSVSQSEGNLVSDMDGEKVMLSIQNGKYYNLGEIGGDIWEFIKDPITIQNLIIKLRTNYDVEESECKKEVLTFLEQLLEENLIEIETPARKE